MKKTLTAIALFTALAAGTANATPMFEQNPLGIRNSEGFQNFLYYFGSNCCASTMADRGGRPCGPRAMAPAPVACDTCPAIAMAIPMEERCFTCNPCGDGWGWLPWNW